jgi:hypothetical protein
LNPWVTITGSAFSLPGAALFAILGWYVSLGAKPNETAVVSPNASVLPRTSAILVAPVQQGQSPPSFSNDRKSLEDFEEATSAIVAPERFEPSNQAAAGEAEHEQTTARLDHSPSLLFALPSVKEGSRDLPDYRLPSATSDMQSKAQEDASDRSVRPSLGPDEEAKAAELNKANTTQSQPPQPGMLLNRPVPYLELDGQILSDQSPAASESKPKDNLLKPSTRQALIAEQTTNDPLSKSESIERAPFQSKPVNNPSWSRESDDEESFAHATAAEAKESGHELEKSDSKERTPLQLMPTSPSSAAREANDQEVALHATDSTTLSLNEYVNPVERESVSQSWKVPLPRPRPKRRFSVRTRQNAGGLPSALPSGPFFGQLWADDRRTAANRRIRRAPLVAR